jgi:hypothetical protein
MDSFNYIQLNVEILLGFSIKVSKPEPSQQQKFLKTNEGVLSNSDIYLRVI